MLGQLYADDVQAYQHCLASEALVTVNAMNRTMEALGSWMSSNRLRLNPLKTQFILLGTRQQLAKLDMVAHAHLPFLTLLSPQQSATLVSPWIRNSPLLPT